MENELKKKFLSLYADNAAEIRRLEDEISLWKSRAEKCTAVWRATPAHGVPTAHAEDCLADLRTLLRARLDSAAAVRLQIGKSIATVEDARLRLILEYRYIDGKTWESIAAALNCDCRWILRLHARALAAVNLQGG